MGRREDRIYGATTIGSLLLAGTVFYLSKDFFGIMWGFSIVFILPLIVIPYAICGSILEKENNEKFTYCEKCLPQKQKVARRQTMQCRHQEMQCLQPDDASYNFSCEKYLFQHQDVEICDNLRKF